MTRVRRIGGAVRRGGAFVRRAGGAVVRRAKPAGLAIGETAVEVGGGGAAALLYDALPERWNPYAKGAILAGAGLGLKAVRLGGMGRRVGAGMAGAGGFVIVRAWRKRPTA